MKKVLSVLLALCLIIGAVPMFASAEDGSGAFGNLTWTVKDRVITISGNGPTPDYTGYNQNPVPWGEFTTGKGAPAEAIVIEHGVNRIGSYAFSMIGCKSLSFPMTLDSIGESAFELSGIDGSPNNPPIESVNIPSSVSYIGPNAFRDFGAKTYTLQEGVFSIYEGSFSDPYMEEIYLPQTISVDEYTGAGKDALKDTYALRDIYYAGSEAEFQEEGLEILGYDTSAVTVHYDTPVPSGPVSPVATSGSCGAQGDNVKWNLSNGTLTISGTGDMQDFNYETPWWESGDYSKVIIENGVTSIGALTFREDRRINEVTIPATVTKIGRTAFAFCLNLKDVYFEGTEEQWKKVTLGEDAFVRSPVSFHFKDGGDTPNPPQPPVGGFSDVKAGEYYSDPVVWAVDSSITSGIGGGKFGTGRTCTRGQIATFLWNAAGQPEPQSSANPFKDVMPSDYYYTAVLWAAEQGITSGTGDGTLFSPKAGCTRAEAMTFIWRAHGKPEPDTAASFKDMPSNSDFRKAISWAVENGITSGIGDGTRFGPSQPCKREQIVTFLYNARYL